MKALFSVAAMLAAALVSPATAEDMHKIAKPDTLQWGPSPRLPKGAEVAVLHGNPGRAGQYIILAKFPDGYAVPAHWHTQSENVTVISGTFNVGMGDKLDRSKGEPLKAGGFFSSGPMMHHYAWTTGETMIQVTGMGPFDVTYVDPKDDPANVAKN
jgi:hypothetical protein